MNSISEQYTSNTFAKSTIVISMLTGILLTLSVKNAQADKISSIVRQYQVEISAFAFMPKELKVNIGDTITWINKDIVPHNIVASTQQKSISAVLSNGDRYTLIVKDTMLYKCGLHPSMTGKILLFDSPNH